MKLRTILLSAGLASFLGSCHKPMKMTQLPKPQPVAYETSDNLHFRVYSTGYEVILERNYIDIASYSFNQGKACLSLHAPGKDWVEICAVKDKVVSLNNYDMRTACDFKRGDCASSLNAAERIFAKWKRWLHISKYHKRWLKEKNKPLKDWL